MNFEFSQRLRAANPPVWAVPGTEVLCLVVRESTGIFGSSCTSIRRVTERGTFIALLADPSGQATGARRVVVGLAPNGVREVLVHTPGLPLRPVQVVDNVFALHDNVPTPPESIAPRPSN